MKIYQIITILGIFFFFPLLVFSQDNSEKNNTASTLSSPKNEEYKVITITQEEFIEKIFDYRTDSILKFKGTKPVVVDFYADWCAPCRMLAPILEELQKEYKDKIQIYKINTDKNREVSSVFRVVSIPTILFIPMSGNPAMEKGVLPKETLEKIFEDFLKVSKK